MNKRIKILIVAAAVAGLLAPPAALATEALSKEFDVKCTSCHDKAGSKRLTSKGKYFELKRSFDGYDDLMSKYRKCTKCHAKAPGSQTLTKKGEKLKARGKTMDHVILEPATEDAGDDN